MLNTSRVVYCLKNLGILDLFSGPGGLSLGFSQAGYHVLVSLDNDENALSTTNFNQNKINEVTKLGNHYSINQDITETSSDDIIKIFKKENKSVFGIIGGPPCRGFSLANQQTRYLDNPLNNLINEYIRLIREIKPRFFVVENVPQLFTVDNGRLLNEIILELSEIGYTCSQQIINSSNFGIPQIRRRAIIIGSLDGNKIKIPINNGSNKTITVHDAISDFPHIKNGHQETEMKYKHNQKLTTYMELMRNSKEFGFVAKSINNHIVSKNGDLVIKRFKALKQGENWSNLPQNLLENYKDAERCHSSIYKRFRWDEPSPTISNIRKNMFIHPDQDRGISVREAARLQSFPDWYEFKGKIGSLQQQVGDAVPPLMAKEIALTIKKHYKL